MERRRMRENVEFAPRRHMLALSLTPGIRLRQCKTVSVYIILSPWSSPSDLVVNRLQLLRNKGLELLPLLLDVQSEDLLGFFHLVGMPCGRMYLPLLCVCECVAQPSPGKAGQAHIIPGRRKT
jgi:hypothetical protein